MATIIETREMYQFHQKGRADMNHIRSDESYNGPAVTLMGHSWWANRDDRHIIAKGNEINGLLASH